MDKSLYDVIISDELTWEGLIRDIVRDEGMDPWNIDVKQLAIKFSGEIKKMKSINLRISGKFILAASILLKMKSDLLLNEKESESDDGVSLSWLFKDFNYDIGPSELIPRIPMIKKRRVTLDELISALNKAIEVSDRRVTKRIEKEERVIPIGKGGVDLKEKINEVYSAITNFFKNLKRKEINFSELLPSKQRFDVIWTFMPLLHLSNKGKVLLVQEKTFGDIIVRKP